MLKAIAMLFAVLSWAPATAQQLNMTPSLFSPGAYGQEYVAGVDLPILACDMSAAGGDVDILSLEAQLNGTASFSQDLDATSPAALWIDDGDGAFDSVADQPVASASLLGSTLTFTLSSSFVVTSGSSASVWLSLRPSTNAGVGPIDTFSVVIAGPQAVGIASGQVSLSPSPIQSSVLTIVELTVTSFSPSCGGKGDAITIRGSGFTAPLEVRIDGALCLGSPSVSGDGTIITGLSPPPQPGLQSKDLPITIQTSILPTRLMPQTFSYCLNHGTGNDGTCSTCAVDAYCSERWVVAIIALVVTALPCRLRRYSAG
ncbi:MAG: IPT/TIG domain-containing protein [Planctomycetes bacterium]|nr:IPT/TIG domain-containing protein [Planctomycetota bacterium]